MFVFSALTFGVSSLSVWGFILLDYFNSLYHWYYLLKLSQLLEIPNCP